VLTPVRSAGSHCFDKQIFSWLLLSHCPQSRGNSRVEHPLSLYTKCQPLFITSLPTQCQHLAYCKGNIPWNCCLRRRGDLVQGQLGDPPLGRSGHQLADTNVVDSKWRLLINNAALYSLGLQHHFSLLTSRAKRYWLSGEGGDSTFPYSATSSDRQALTTHRNGSTFQNYGVAGTILGS